MKTTAIPERRRSVRYIVGGKVIFPTGSPEFSGDLVNISPHGMLVRTKVCVPEGTKLQVGFTVAGYPVAFQASSQVVGAQPELLAMKFLDDPPELAQLLGWLEREHLPWTGLDAPDGAGGAPSQGTSQTLPAPSAVQDERQELETILPFLDSMG